MYSHLLEKEGTSTSTRQEKGSGIGLSLSKQIMLKMNGDIVLNSKEDMTTFTIILN